MNYSRLQTPLQMSFWGDRYGLVIDPYGHKWEIAHPFVPSATKNSSAVVSVMKGCKRNSLVSRRGRTIFSRRARSPSEEEKWTPQCEHSLSDTRQRTLPEDVYGREG